MKNILIALFIFFCTHCAVAQIQISNSKWEARLEIPRQADVDMEFTKDTFRIVSKVGREFEVMFFSQHNDSLYIRKISGITPCPDGAEGWYRIEWLENGEKFFLQPINDSCTRRSNSFKTFQITKRIRSANEASRKLELSEFN